MEKYGTRPKTDNLTFGHVHKDNGKFMTSQKTQIIFYYLSMTKIMDKCLMFCLNRSLCNVTCPKTEIF